MVLPVIVLPREMFWKKRRGKADAGVQKKRAAAVRLTRDVLPPPEMRRPASSSSMASEPEGASSAASVVESDVSLGSFGSDGS
tara:strand:- start:3243 stop:3491 length:249 start_codon:yes stop_codon:yes gene_type:complete